MFVVAIVIIAVVVLIANLIPVAMRHRLCHHSVLAIISVAVLCDIVVAIAIVILIASPLVLVLPRRLCQEVAGCDAVAIFWSDGCAVGMMACSQDDLGVLWFGRGF